MQGHLLQKTNLSDQFLHPLIKFSLLWKYCSKVHLNTRFAICTQGNIAQGGLHLWNKKVVMLQHLLFDYRNTGDLIVQEYLLSSSLKEPNQEN